MYANAAEYDGRFEETPEDSLGNFRTRFESAEGIGSTATNARWTFGVVPVRFQPRTQILKATYSERRSESFAAVKKLGNEKRGTWYGKDRE